MCAAKRLQQVANTKSCATHRTKSAIWHVRVSEERGSTRVNEQELDSVKIISMTQSYE